MPKRKSMSAMAAGRPALPELLEGFNVALYRRQLMARADRRIKPEEMLRIHDANFLLPGDDGYEAPPEAAAAAAAAAAQSGEPKDDAKAENKAVTNATSTTSSKTLLTKADLADLCRYKLARGTWRPRMQQLVEGNSSAAVDDAIANARRLLDGGHFHDAIESLCVLQGVGAATASLVMSSNKFNHARSHECPFMSDEAVAALPALGNIMYDLRFYKRYRAAMTDLARELPNTDTRAIERAMWSAATVAAEHAPKVKGKKKKKLKRN